MFLELDVLLKSLNVPLPFSFNLHSLLFEHILPLYFLDTASFVSLFGSHWPTLQTKE